MVVDLQELIRTSTKECLRVIEEIGVNIISLVRSYEHEDRPLYPHPLFPWSRVYN